MAAQFDKCYGCIQLRRGCITIGYVKLILSVLLIAASVVGILYGKIFMSDLSRPNKHLQFWGLVMVIGFSLALVTFVLQFAFTMVLLVGLHQNKRRLLKAYLIFSVIVFCFSIIGAIPLLYFSIFSFSQLFLALAFTAYHLMLIKSYYVKMDVNNSVKKQYDIATITKP